MFLLLFSAIKIPNEKCLKHLHCHSCSGQFLTPSKNVWKWHYSVRQIMHAPEKWAKWSPHGPCLFVTTTEKNKIPSRRTSPISSQSPPLDLIGLKWRVFAYKFARSSLLVRLSVSVCLFVWVVNIPTSTIHLALRSLSHSMWCVCEGSTRGGVAFPIFPPSGDGTPAEGEGRKRLCLWFLAWGKRLGKIPGSRARGDNESIHRGENEPSAAMHELERSVWSLGAVFGGREGKRTRRNFCCSSKRLLEEHFGMSAVKRSDFVIKYLNMV